MIDVRARLAAAVNRRLAPNTGLHPKQLAARIGHGREWLRLVRDARVAAKLDDVLAMARVFSDGQAFLAEVLDLRSDAAAMWFTHDGKTLPAVAGLAETVRRDRGFPLHQAGDLCAYAERNFGWIGAQVGERVLTLSYDDVGICVNAADVASRWLQSVASKFDCVHRRVRIDDSIVERADADPLAAAASVLRAAEIVASPLRVPWRIERLSLSAVAAFSPFIKAWHENPNSIVEAAAALGKLPECSLLRVSGTNVETIEIGSRIPFKNKAELVGRNVLDRADLSYGHIVHSHMLGCVEGPTVHRCVGSIFETPWAYDRLALYSGSETGICLSVPIRHSRAEALADVVGLC